MGKFRPWRAACNFSKVVECQCFFLLVPFPFPFPLLPPIGSQQKSPFPMKMVVYTLVVLVRATLHGCKRGRGEGGKKSWARLYSDETGFHGASFRITQMAGSNKAGCYSFLLGRGKGRGKGELYFKRFTNVYQPV